MSADVAPNSTFVSDLPPWTWRGWWRERPKWLRIGCWAMLGLLLSHVFVVLRLFVGQIEDQDIQSIRQRGGHVYYSWAPVFTKAAAPPAYERFSGYDWINVGIWGRNRMYVIEMSLSKATDADLQFICTRFPNLKSLMLTEADVSRAGLAELAKLKQLQSLYVHDSDIGDDEAIVLTTIPTLVLLGFNETRVTDVLIPHLKQMKLLRWICLSCTNVSPEEIAALHATGRWVIDCETLGFVPSDLYGSFRWSDNRRNYGFRGSAELGIEGPLGTDQSQVLIKEIPGRTDNQPLMAHRHLHWPAAELKNFTDGDYRFTLKLGQYDSEPVIIHIESGVPSIHNFEFLMPVTRKQALGAQP